MKKSIFTIEYTPHCLKASYKPEVDRVPYKGRADVDRGVCPGEPVLAATLKQTGLTYRMVLDEAVRMGHIKKEDLRREGYTLPLPSDDEIY